MAGVFENDKGSLSMKNIAIISTSLKGSIGKIGINLFNHLKGRGYNIYFFYGRGEDIKQDGYFLFEKKTEFYTHVLLSRITGNQGAYSMHATRKLTTELKKKSVDTVFLLETHGYYLNERTIYTFIAEENIRMVKLMIDEYDYLGNCSNDPCCETFISGKGKCPNIHRYPDSLFFDRCEMIIKRKATLYERIKKHSIFVGPQYVIDKAHKSFLAKYMTFQTLDEAIDLELYKPRETTSLRRQLGIQDNQKVILCVAPKYKGIQYFQSLAQEFNSNKDYYFIHVGSGDDKTTTNYLKIDFIKENSDLALYYSLADLFIFPSLVDTMPNACLEALACGTPLMVFNISGMPYILDDTVGKIVEVGDVNAMKEVVLETKIKSAEIVDKCRDYACRRYDGKKYSAKLEAIAKSLE